MTTIGEERAWLQGDDIFWLDVFILTMKFRYFQSEASNLIAIRNYVLFSFEKLQSTFDITFQFLFWVSRECQWHNTTSWTMLDLNTIGDFDDGSFCSFSIYGRGSSSIQAGKKTPEKCHPPTTKSIICGIPSKSTKTQEYMAFQPDFLYNTIEYQLWNK